MVLYHSCGSNCTSAPAKAVCYLHSVLARLPGRRIMYAATLGTMGLGTKTLVCHSVDQKMGNCLTYLARLYPIRGYSSALLKRLYCRLAGWFSVQRRELVVLATTSGLKYLCSHDVTTTKTGYYSKGY